MAIHSLVGRHFKDVIQRLTVMFATGKFEIGNGQSLTHYGRESIESSTLRLCGGFFCVEFLLTLIGDPEYSVPLSADHLVG